MELSRLIDKKFVTALTARFCSKNILLILLNIKYLILLLNILFYMICFSPVGYGV